MTRAPQADCKDPSHALLRNRCRKRNISMIDISTIARETPSIINHQTLSYCIGVTSDTSLSLTSLPYLHCYTTNTINHQQSTIIILRNRCQKQNISITTTAPLHCIDITTPSPSPSVHGLLFTLSPSLSPANLQQLNCKTHTSDTNTITFIPTIIF